jgi:hypothetical protein
MRMVSVMIVPILMVTMMMLSSSGVTAAPTIAMSFNVTVKYVIYPHIACIAITYALYTCIIVKPYGNHV